MAFQFSDIHYYTDQEWQDLFENQRARFNQILYDILFLRKLDADGNAIKDQNSQHTIIEWRNEQILKAHVQLTNRLLIACGAWDDARQFFKNNPHLTKYKKKKNFSPFCSFERYDRTI